MIIPTLLFAIGIESLCKGIIYNINHLFIYIEPSFNNILPVLYKEKIISNRTTKTHSDDKEPVCQKLNSNPKNDVLNFSESYYRAQYFSLVTRNHKQTILRLKSVRDRISHCLLKELNENTLKDILSQFKFLIFEYEKELGFKIIEAQVDINEYNKQKLELQTKVHAQLENHKKIWEMHQLDKLYVKNARINTIMMNSLHPDVDDGVIIECPACKQRAVLLVILDLGMNDYAETVVENISIRKVNCDFCKLAIDKPDEIDFLKLNEAKEISINWTSDGDHI